jgi:diadenosine tetraphosphatase ApaH/serine/threonine PP2A family protein phosphatase
MRTALISDIHGNLQALQAVLDDIGGQNVDEIHCLGDVVGYGAAPVACLDLVADRCRVKLMGNHEFAALGLQSTEHYNEAAKTSNDWTSAQLDDRARAMISDFSMEANLDDMYLVHASPFQPDQWHYVFDRRSAQAALGAMPGKLGFCGHTHIPNVISDNPSGPPRSRAGHDIEPDPERHYLVNVGSVGQPRDNDPRACYVIYDHDEAFLTFRRVEYNIDAAQKTMLTAGLPKVLSQRLSTGV